MIFSVINEMAEQISDYLKLALSVKEEIVHVSALGENAAVPPNKLIISLANIERETAAGIPFGIQKTSENLYKRNAPPIHLNLYILIAAVFSEKQYKEGLRVLSAAIEFIRNNNSFTLPGIQTPFSIEPYNLSFNELSNLWSICGRNYYPSILCKLRLLDFSNEEIQGIVPAVREKHVTL